MLDAVVVDGGASKLDEWRVSAEHTVIRIVCPDGLLAQNATNSLLSAATRKVVIVVDGRAFATLEEKVVGPHKKQQSYFQRAYKSTGQ